MIENKLSADNKEALKDFLRKGDRRDPFLFVGREEILVDIEEQLQETRQAQKSVENARVIQGPPGSGKSSLLREAAKRYAESDLVVRVDLSGEALSDPVLVARAFLDAYGIDPLVLQQGRTERVAGSFRMLWTGVDRTVERDEPAPSDRLQERRVSVWDLLDQRLQMPQETVFLVTVDEAQRVAPDVSTSNDKRNAIALNLADARTGKIKTFTIFGGLSDTAIRLKSVEVSPRLVQGGLHQIAELECQDVRTLANAFLVHEPFGLSKLEFGRASMIETITRAADCYPRHIQAYLRGLAKEFSSDAPLIDTERALQRGREYRATFYHEIVQGAKLYKFGKVLIALAQQTSPDKSFSYDDIVELTTSEFGMSEDMVSAHYEAAIHGGVLFEPLGSSPVTGPIDFSVPSLRTYFSTGFDLAQTVQSLRQMEELGGGR